MGFAVAEAALPADSNLSKLFYECKDYISAVYQADLWNEKLDDICKVPFCLTMHNRTEM